MIFNGCPTINDQGLKGFDEDFVEMKELKRVVFTFAGCEYVTKEGLGWLSTSVSKAPKFKGLAWNLSK